MDEAQTLHQREQWLDKVIQAKGLPVVWERDPVTKKMTSKVATIDDLMTPAKQETPEKPAASSAPPPAQMPAAASKPSAFKNKAANQSLGTAGAQPTPQEPAAPGKPSPFKKKVASADDTVGAVVSDTPAKKRIIAGREIPLALDQLEAVLSAPDESEPDPAEETLHRLGNAISDHKTATDAGWGVRLSSILGLCDIYLESHHDPSKGWAGKRVAVVEDLKAEAMLERARRLAEVQYLEDAYARPSDSPTALSAQSEKTRKFVHSAAQEVAARVASSDKFAGLSSNSPMAWATMAADIYGLTEAEILAVMVYTSDDYKYINAATANDKALIQEREFDGKPEDYLTSDEGRAEMKRFFEEGSLHGAMAIAALQKLDDVPGTCYRGSRMTPERFKQRYGDAQNKKYPSRTLSGLTSCSTSKDSAAVFANKSDESDATVSVMTEIAVTHGRDISDLSLYPGEKELLLLPGAVLQTVSWEPEPNWGDGKPAATMWVHVKAKEE